MASPWQKRTSQLSPLNAGPAGSRPVKYLVRIRGCSNKHMLQQRNIYMLLLLLLLTGPAYRRQCSVCLCTERSGYRIPVSVKFSAPFLSVPDF